MTKTAYIYKIGQLTVGDKVHARLISINVCEMNPTTSSPKTQVFKDISKINGEVLWTVMMYLEDLNEDSQMILKTMMLPAAKALEQFLLENVNKSFSLDSPIFPSAIHDK